MNSEGGVHCNIDNMLIDSSGIIQDYENKNLSEGFGCSS